MPLLGIMLLAGRRRSPPTWAARAVARLLAVATGTELLAPTPQPLFAGSIPGEGVLTTMRTSFAAFLFALSGPALAQPCTVSPPAFVVSCPCPGQGPFLNFTGTTRIGTVQRYRMVSEVCHPSNPSFLVVGLPIAVPLPIPNGLVTCSGDMSPVSSFPIDPIYVVYEYPDLVDVSGCASLFVPYFLFIPNQANLVGLTVRAQFFELLSGNSNTVVPFAASAVVGFTVQP